MSRLSDFFHGDDTQFGIFYPNHYIVAAFPSKLAADHAISELRNSGRAKEDVIAASGDEVVQFAEDHWINDGLWGKLMESVSRLIGTEAAYADKDLAAARAGTAFIAVHCPTDKLKSDAWGVLAPQHPLVARYYHWDGIDHLAGEN
jgi:hypothetical protein